MIAVDLMGGDFAPGVVVEGVLAAAKKGVPIVLFGPEQVALELLGAHQQDWHSLPIQLVNASEVIGMHEEPVAAVRKKQDASLVKAIGALAADKVAAVVSAGHSGALMVASVFILGRQDGVERPAIAGLFPTPNGFVIGLDLGANTDCKPHHLAQFAFLGDAYAKKLLGLTSPRIALLSNGEEDSKGSLLTKEVFQILKAEQNLNFIGNREPHDILKGCADVFVCDGFTGNIFLKTFEITFEQRTNSFQELVSSLNLLSVDLVNSIKQRLDESNFLKKMGGALLIGVKKPVFICHGAADAGEIEQAILTAFQYVKTVKN